MNNNTKVFVIGFTSSFAAGLVLVYLYTKWYHKETAPLRLQNDNITYQYQY